MTDGPVFPARLARTRLYEQVAEQISTWITDNGLSAGDRLPPERELATRLGVSRATLSQGQVVRSALRRLGAGGPQRRRRLFPRHRQENPGTNREEPEAEDGERPEDEPAPAGKTERQTER